MRKKWAPAWLFLIPGGFVLAAFVYYPIAKAFWLSFQSYDVFSAPRCVGLDNFKELVENPNFWTALSNSLLYVVVTPILACGSIALAILVDRKRPGIAFFRAAYFIPVVMPMVVAAMAWRFIFPAGWLTSTKLALACVMFVTIWKGLGYYMMIFLAGLQSVPRNLYEAAALDGASRWIVFRRITFPYLRPTLILVVTLSAAAAVKVFDEVYVLTGGGPLRSSATLVFSVYESAFAEFPPRLGVACAAGVVVFLVAGIVTFIQRKLLR